MIKQQCKSFINFTILVFCLLLVFSCKKKEEKVIPQGKLILSFHKPVFWRIYDSVALEVRTDLSFCSGNMPFSYNISGNDINMEMDMFTSYDCEMMYKLEQDIRFKNLENIVYKIKINRPHRQDSASIYITDSMFVTRPESDEIEFEKDTIRRILPNTIWVSFNYCKNIDSIKIAEIDSAMKASGAQPKSLTPGDYEYFYVNRDFTIRPERESSCYKIFRTYDFGGNYTNMLNFHRTFKLKYNYMHSFTIRAWDKIIVW